MGTNTDNLDGIYEIKYTQGGFKLNEVEGGTGPGGEFERTGANRGGRLLFHFGRTKIPVLKFPLSVGQKWTYEYSLGRPGSGGGAQQRSVEVNVVGLEDVTTPAGTFKAFKLVKGYQGRRIYIRLSYI